MKTKVRNATYDEVMALPRQPHELPQKPGMLFRTLMRVLGAPDLKQTDFSFTEKEMERAGGGPWLILMNHSAFIDLEIAARILYPRPYCIICTSDGFVGKDWLMRKLGCIPTQKFVSDITLIRDMQYTVDELKTSILMYPEASYSFDGTATPLPRGLGVLVKRLGVPVVMIKTEGAFARDPLYNCLQKRKVKVSAEVSCLLDKDQISVLGRKEIESVLDEAFTFDNFAWQRDNRVSIDEPFRADGLERIMFKCPHCGTEGETKGEGTALRCAHCGKEWSMDEFGQMHALEGETEFPHVPDWYAWEREEVRRSLLDGTYLLDTDVSIGMMVDHKYIYMVGDGHLVHDVNGFRLTGCDGKLDYEQKPLESYSLYSDYFWYEIGDVICIGNKDCLYYCFPKKEGVVAKTRIAAEELYKICDPKNRR
ncbi:MAG: 1-acyl-sn-glycerol-3-phosphate acyltransferase [Oscillospiraceae bacterium]|nr:1-acyl-sn-glycerol-3-phosphate acyltransferase [Oscillospiraceae bacterium]MBQ5342663.1 1-acyl-sn-glycerol-3-phosphate acyltransferase [Oscillospiraceae bacterium]